MNKLIKDMVSDVDIVLRTFRSNALKGKVIDVVSDGIKTNPSLLEPSQCYVLRNEIDRCLKDSNINVWQDDLGSDKRIYGFESVAENFHDIFDVQELRKIGEAYLGRKIICYFALAARLDPVAGNAGSGGGWHRDSAFSHQFKAIVYLNDVLDENGPFQYVLGSHRSRSKLVDFGVKELDRTRYSDKQLAPFMDRVQTFTGEEGDALYVDTRGIHRGKPITRGTRYAITFYFWTNSPGEKFNSYLQSGLSFLS